MEQRENGCRCSDKETKNEKRRVYVEKRKMYMRAVTRAKKIFEEGRQLNLDKLVRSPRNCGQR